MEDFGKLVLRVTLGLLVLLHGIAKLKSGVGPLIPMVEGFGLPSWVAYGVFLGEILGPLLLILGLFSRTGAFLVFTNMVFAVALAHRGELFSLTKQGGYALELQAMFLLTALALIFLSPGRYAMTRRY